ncbi:Cytochrome B561 [Methylocella tundrae]|uniref:Cytochrome B561 n=1 Tax=Methylocella tundrae TaxID=227605 RepID=A0A8B6M761_METTU|nr:cytochrome b/b6 domain-containing protein [Methylocella tundrae]VTZ28272.1 Cytochrome B561 [Methylocella tundrae]VTZ49912.1 Cytochrome B561 [Methylocella tundrae]
MSDKTSSNYDQTTIFLHWITAALVVVLWILGQTSDLVPRGPLRTGSWSLHVTLGFLLAFVLIGRIIWRGGAGRRLPPADAGFLQFLAAATHYALYALLLAAVTLGIINAFVRGYDLFGVVSLPKLGDPALKKPITEWHELAANLVLAVALLHAAAALAHHYVLKDGVLLRMLPQREAASERRSDL